MRKRELHSIRIAYENWENQERFESLLTLLKKYDCGIDSAALFTSSTHAPLTLAETERRVGLMKERMKRLRELGFQAGINILATIGHHEEDLEASFRGDYAFMTGEDGRICRGSRCMNDERYLFDYVRPVYEMLAKADPDFIWIDDDVRYGHMPVGFTCFCEGCISRFNRENGSAHTRESLVEALHSGDLKTRRAWLRHNSTAISGLFRLISKTVRNVKEDMLLGFMTGERFVEGYDFTEYADALSDGGKHEIMWRPGMGGGYNDCRFDELMEKTEEEGRQNALLPEYVTIVQSEVENFPYQLIKKSPVSTALEAAWSMTSGCTGAAFNILVSETGEPLENVEPHFEELVRFEKLFRLLKEKTAGKQPVGIGTSWRPDDQIAVPAGSYNDYYGNLYAACARELFDFGLPQCYKKEHRLVSLLHHDNVAHWSDDEIRGVLSRGVYMDAWALDAVNGRGFGALTGFEKGEHIPADAREKYLAHPLNEGIEGRIRNCRQAFNFGDSDGMLPSDDRAGVLASLVDYHDNTLAICSHGIFENDLGGRISAAGYYPFSWISDHSKIMQLKKLMVWLSGGKLPSYVDTVCRIRNHTFIDGDRCVVALLNPGNQPLKGVRVAIRTEKTIAIWYDLEANAHEVACEETEDTNGYRFVTIEKLPAFEIALIEV